MLTFWYLIDGKQLFKWNVSNVDYLHAALHNIKVAEKGNLH